MTPAILHPGSALAQKIGAALASREHRNIRRRLPAPEASITAGTFPASTTAVDTLIDFNSNDYLSLSTSALLRSHFLNKLQSVPPSQPILGSGGSRLLVNGFLHSNFEERLRTFFRSETALLFNSGFDANVGVFSSLPQEGDVVLYDEYIHASVHDGLRASKLMKQGRDNSRHSNPCQSFAHNCLSSFHQTLLSMIHSHPSVKSGQSSLFVAVESLYSMDGTFAPLEEIVEILEREMPLGNGYLIVDEAHATGIYGPEGKGRVAQLGLEDKVLLRLHTFGKALAATGAVILTNTLIRDFLLNYARSLIYTTSLSNTNIIAADASFDMLQNGTSAKLAHDLFNISSYFLQQLHTFLPSVPAYILSLPSHLSTSPSSSGLSQLDSHSHTQSTESQRLLSPIIPLLTSHARPLSLFLLSNYNINARPITWPTVPKGQDRIRVCLHSSNTFDDVDLLVEGLRKWVSQKMVTEDVKEETLAHGRSQSARTCDRIGVRSGLVALQSKL